MQLYDNADCICCMCALMGNLSLDVAKAIVTVSFPKRVSS